MHRYWNRPTSIPTSKDDPDAAIVFALRMSQFGEVSSDVRFQEFRRIGWSLIEEMRRFGGKPERALRGLHVNILKADGFNARVDAGSDYDLIAINEGLIQTIATFYSLAFSHPQAFSEWDGALLEQRSFIRFPKVNWAGGYTRVKRDLAFAGLGNQLSPKSNLRIDGAARLISYCFHFIFLHEVGHLMGGHLDGSYSMESPDSFFEFGGSPFGEGETRQAFELHADSFAVWALMNSGFKGGLLKRLPGEDEVFMAEFFAAISLLFCLMSSPLEDSKKLADPTRSHPHPAVRHLNAFNFAASYAHQGLGWSTQRTRQTFERVWAKSLRPMYELTQELGFDQWAWRPDARMRRNGRKQVRWLSTILAIDLVKRWPPRVDVNEVREGPPWRSIWYRGLILWRRFSNWLGKQRWSAGLKLRVWE